MYLSENKKAFFLWFGAAISLVDMMTGMQLASLGLPKAFSAIFAGLFVGCAIFFCAGLIGAKEKMSGMQSTSLAFGSKGSLFFAFLNVIQLIGWTAVMLQFGGMTAEMIFSVSSLSIEFWIALFSFGLFVWIISGAKGFNNFHSLLIIVLFLVCMTILYRVLSIGNGATTEEVVASLTFALGFDLALALPLSWTPLIADYTKNAKNPLKFTLTCALGYFIASFSMFSLGLLGAYYLDLSEIVPLFALVGGTLSLFVLFFSTVTTAYLDVYSAAESLLHILPIKSSAQSHKYISIGILAISTVVAQLFSSAYFEPFLYVIASVFLPMLTILILEYYFIKEKSSAKKIHFVNIFVWFMAFLLYNSSFVRNSMLGSSSTIILTIFLVYSVKYIVLGKYKNKKNLSE